MGQYKNIESSLYKDLRQRVNAYFQRFSKIRILCSIGVSCCSTNQSSRGGTFMLAKSALLFASTLTLYYLVVFQRCFILGEQHSARVGLFRGLIPLLALIVDCLTLVADEPKLYVMSFIALIINDSLSLRPNTLHVL